MRAIARFLFAAGTALLAGAMATEAAWYVSALAGVLVAIGVYGWSDR